MTPHAPLVTLLSSGQVAKCRQGATPQQLYGFESRFLEVTQLDTSYTAV